MKNLKPLYIPKHWPMRIVLFSSGGPGNTNALFAVQDTYPGLIKVVLCVADRPGIPTLIISESRGVPCLIYDFEKEYQNHANHCTDKMTKAQLRMLIHNRILKDILCFEEISGRIDFAILAYRRLIEGKLLDYFQDRMINQHPADLTIFDCSTKNRKYIGIHGHSRIIKDSCGGSRTSCILVNSGIDSGEILGQGAFLPFAAEVTTANINDHENRQKEHSDWPILQFVVKGIAEGRYSLSSERFPDGNRKVYYDGKEQPYCGFRL
jgi:folate-dependent phosphoribosylglycinamide formyltransferase PurN